LWYLCREWQTNGRWYYEGQENSVIKRDHPLLSQEAVCGQYAALALPYLAAYGIDIHPELDSLSGTLHFLITHRPDSYPVEPSATRYVRSWLTFGKTRGLRPGNTLLLRTYVQVTGAGADSMVLLQKLPDMVNRPDRLAVIVTHDGKDTTLAVPVSSDGSYAVPVGSAPYKAWDLYTVDATVTLNARFTVDEFPMDKPVVNVTPTPTGAAVPYTGDVQDYHYQTRINSQNFLDVPRWYYFPHNPGAGG
ncbi:MAG: hypothetical protein LC772_05505, partial [Chloroflexi bacterium]|nr:hypothetical protein [Chloroflexota bacterium]